MERKLPSNSSTKGDELRTPNLSCPACLEFRCHTVKELRDFHPNAGKGLDRRNTSITKEVDK